MNSLNIGVDSWIIQDGNYDDFTVNQRTNFAIEFYPYSLLLSESKTVSIEELSYTIYKINGQIIYCTEKVWVLDFGFLAFQETNPPDFAAKGVWVEGEISLGIDPYFYSAYLRKLPGMPSLTYNFKLEEILLETTPWIEDTSKKMLCRDTERTSFQKVNNTDAWNDDNGIGSYILKCLIDSD